MSRERLQKLMARAGVASRRQAEDMIRQGRVTLNGQEARLGDRADLNEDAVKIDGRRLKPSQKPKVYLLVNKPRAVVSTVSDPEDRSTVIEIVPERLHKGLVPVGRLDYDSEGLLLLTDDGEFAHRVAHPRFGCIKTYEVKVKGRPKPGDIDRLRQGVKLEGRLTAPAQVEAFRGPEGKREPSTSTWWRVAIGEGRTRQIREMFLRIGHPVQRLRRVAIGSVSDSRLPRGSWRELTPEEIEALQSGTGRAPALSRGRRSPAAGRKSAGGDREASKKRGRSADAGPPRGRRKPSPASGSKPKTGAGGGAGKPRAGGSASRSAGSPSRPGRPTSGRGGSKSGRGTGRGPKNSGRRNPR